MRGRALLLVACVACGSPQPGAAEPGPAQPPDAGAVASGPPSEDECRAVIEHVLAISMTAERKATFDDTERAAFLREAIPECQQTMTRAQLACMSRATSADDVYECGP